MKEYLVEIESKYLPDLKKLYALDESKSYTAFTTIDYYIRCFELDPNVKHINVYCLNGDFSDGTFVVTDRCIAFADTSSESYERLNRLLQLLDYSKGYTFLSIRREIHPVIKDALQKASVDLTMDNETLLYYLPKKEALKFNSQPPGNTSLRPVKELHDFEKANMAWPKPNPKSIPFFHRMAKYNPNSGAFKEYDGTMVAWVFQLPTGFLGALRTDEKHSCKGYGGLVVRDISKKIAELGQDIYASVSEKNIPSRSLFEKHGFKSIDKVHWLATKIMWSSDDE